MSSVLLNRPYLYFDLLRFTKRSQNTKLLTNQKDILLDFSYTHLTKYFNILRYTYTRSRQFGFDFIYNFFISKINGNFLFTIPFSLCQSSFIISTTTPSIPHTLETLASYTQTTAAITNLS